MDEFQQLKSLLVGSESEQLTDLDQKLQAQQQKFDKLAITLDGILRKEAAKVTAIQNRLNKGQVRAQEISQILPKAIDTACSSNEQLAQSLQRPVEDCLKYAIKKDPKPLADSLFPIMGPAIRRSISETLSGMLQTVNQVLDQSFSVKGLKWRLQAWRSGISFHEVVMRNTLLYRVEQILLIQKETGLLMDHLFAEDVEAQDPDAVSAMLSAIQDFVNDSFSRGGAREQLDQIELGDNVVWLFHGPSALMAVVIRGVPQVEARKDFHEIIEQVHHMYTDQLVEFNGGNPEILAGIRDYLEPGLVSVQKNPGKKGFSPMFWVAVALLSAVLSYWAYADWVFEQKKSVLLSAFKDEPGVFVQSAEKKDDELHIIGLRDPLSVLPEDIVKAAEFDLMPVIFHATSFFSAEPVITGRRISKILQPPNTAKLEYRQQKLIISGHAATKWIDKIRLQAPLIPGISDIDIQSLQTTDTYLDSQLRQNLVWPNEVELVIQDGVAMVSGIVNYPWFLQLQKQKDILPELHEIKSRIEFEEIKEIQRLNGILQTIRLYFDVGQSAVTGQDELSAQLVGVVRQISHLAQQMQANFHFKLVGWADQMGSYSTNQRLAEQRATNVLQFLTQHKGIDESVLTIEPVRVAPEKSSEFRRVDIHLYFEHED